MFALDVFSSFELEEVHDVEVLIIEQDEDYKDILKALLKGDNFKLSCVNSAQEALTKIQEAVPFELIILNAGMNNLSDGHTLIHRIRELTIVPIITLVDPHDEENGSNLVLSGADYDLQKPFTPRRLRAAVTAVLRRTEFGSENPEPILPQTISSGGLDLSLGRLEVSINHKKVNLSAREFSLLQFLMTNPNRTFTREELAAQAWGWAKGGEMRAVDSAIKRLRSKIEEDTRNPLFIVTERNLGYRFVGNNTRYSNRQN